MAGRAALGRALVASGATIFGLGAATMVVSSVSMGVARVVVTHNKKKTAVACCVCSGEQKVLCDVCGGQRAIRYHPFKALPLASSRGPLTACAMCGASGQQTCLNCLGEGSVNSSSSSSGARSRGCSRGGSRSSGAADGSSRANG